MTLYLAKESRLRVQPSNATCSSSCLTKWGLGRGRSEICLTQERCWDKQRGGKSPSADDTTG